MRTVRALVIATLLVIGSSRAAAQESPEIMTDMELGCGRALAGKLAKATAPLVNCFAACLARSGAAPFEGCGVLDAPSDLQLLACIDSALTRVRRVRAGRCAGERSPECCPADCADGVVEFLVGEAAAMAAFSCGPPPADRCLPGLSAELGRYLGELARCQARCHQDADRTGTGDGRACLAAAGGTASSVECAARAKSRLLRRYDALCGVDGSCPIATRAELELILSLFAPAVLDEQLFCRDPQACSDGRVSGLEVCDPTAVPDGCAPGTSCQFGCRACEPRCGDGMIHSSEVCDPAAVPNGCGPGEQCTSGGPLFQECGACMPECFDGVLHPDETCDESATPQGCGLGERCSLCSSCVPVCGDGIVSPAEACDPGATTTCSDGTLCGADCRCRGPLLPSPIDEDFLPCGLLERDIFGFAVEQGQTVAVSADTTSADSAADLCLSLACSQPTVCTTSRGVGSCAADDDRACTFPPPAFGCPSLTMTAAAAVSCQVIVEVCSVPCTSPARGAYRLSVEIDGQPAPLVPLQDDAPES